ncbi:MAG: radical SAM protein [Candidatus Omnitrophica bacterium]|nr:radical SAM protein [Candidatus Omnitrophota bacterium]
MNILFTNFCNQSCPYCFAKEEPALEKKLHPNYIKLKELSVIIDFLKQSKETRVGILGGEPTLHPEFKKAMAMVIQAGLGVTIFTNGLMDRDNSTFLKGIQARKCNVLLNLNSPESYTKKQWSIINRTAGLLRKRMRLGFNIYKLDNDLDFLVDFIQKYNLEKIIRLGMAVPIFGGNNKYIELADYPKVSEKIVNFIEKHRLTGISFTFDCGFTLCSFTDEQLGKLIRLRTTLISSCPPPIDVGPDLKLWHCFATSRMWNKKLTDFKDLQAVIKFYQTKFKAFRQVGATNGCLRCEYLRLDYCSGGCLGHTLKAFKLEDRLENFV